MNQRLDPSDNRFTNATNRPGERATDPVTGAPLGDPLASRSANGSLGEPPIVAPKSRGSWPILIILLAGLVLALLVWMPSEMSNSTASDTATQPAATEPAAVPPAATATPPAATTPSANDTTDPAPAAPTMTTPPAAPATPDTQTPATGTAPAP